MLNAYLSSFSSQMASGGCNATVFFTGNGVYELDAMVSIPAGSSLFLGASSSVSQSPRQAPTRPL